MARVPFLVSLNVCRFFPSHRNRPGTTAPGPSPLADATCRGETLTGREGLPAGKAGTLRIKDGDGTMNGGGGIQLAREGGAFSVCPARLASHTACSVIITIGVKDGKGKIPTPAGGRGDFLARHLDFAGMVWSGRQQGVAMRLLGNILWHFPCFGFVTSLFSFLAGILLTVTVVGAPSGLV